jgi:hypothetical protein
MVEAGFHCKRRGATCENETVQEQVCRTQNSSNICSQQYVTLALAGAGPSVPGQGFPKYVRLFASLANSRDDRINKFHYNPSTKQLSVRTAFSKEAQ